MKDVAGKTAFITGGASGMGLGMAIAFAHAGMKVAIADLREKALEEAMGYFAPEHQVMPVLLDVTDRARWPDAVAEVQARFGNIHVLVNNAGVGVIGPMSTATFKDWDFNMSVNVGGVINGLVTLLPHLKAHGEEAHIVTTSSTGGFSAVGSAGLYCTSKFAVAGMMESLATELQDTPIGVSVFFPGPVETNLSATTAEIRAQQAAAEGLEAPAAGGRPPFDTSLFMGIEEVGARVLRGIRRRDLFIMTHPEFKAGIEARSAALVRAIPVEPPNVERTNLVRMFGTLMYNPVYDTQQPVTEPLEFAGETRRHTNWKMV